MFLFILEIAPGLAKRYFKEPTRIIAIIVFLYIFLGYMFISIGGVIHDLKHGDLNKMKKYNIVFDKSIPFDPS